MDRIITISREYGAGGHSIGQRVAERLGIPFYDKDILRQTARESGYSPELVEAGGEDVSRVDAILRPIVGSSVFYNDPQDAIHDVQAAVMLRFARQGPCVLLGRGGNILLRRAGIEGLAVFIHADDVHRAIRTGQLIESEDATRIQRHMAKKDASRRAWYARYTGRRWGDCHDYGLCLDSGLLGYDRCVDLIVSAARIGEEA